MWFCTSTDRYGGLVIGQGYTPADAYDNYVSNDAQNADEPSKPEECKFYKAEEMKVKAELVWTIF